MEAQQGTTLWREAVDQSVLSVELLEPPGWHVVLSHVVSVLKEKTCMSPSVTGRELEWKSLVTNSNQLGHGPRPPPHWPSVITSIAGTKSKTSKPSNTI